LKHQWAAVLSFFRKMERKISFSWAASAEISNKLSLLTGVSKSTVHTVTFTIVRSLELHKFAFE
jgi:hypothetical protein